MERTKLLKDTEEEHEWTLIKINEGVRKILEQIVENPRATDKSALALALKTMLECRRLEELMQARSTIQKVLEKLQAGGGQSESGDDKVGLDIKTPEQIATEFEDSWGKEAEQVPVDYDIETETKTQTDD